MLIPMLTKLHAAIAAAGLPVVGVSIANPADRSTWRVQLANGTPEQYAQAQAIIDGFDAAKEEHNAAIDAQIAALEASSGGYVRGLREFMLAAASVFKTQGGPDFMANKGMQNVKALDDQIKALRAQRQ